MKKSTVVTEKSNKQLYIVEGEKPKAGEKVSTGGIRRNGKMVSQFTNARPYEEPKSTPAPIVKRNASSVVHRIPTYTMWDRLKERAKESAIDFVFSTGNDLANTFWKRVGIPYIESKMDRLVDKLVATPNDSGQNSVNSTAPDVIDVETKVVNQTDELSNDKIIRFPNERVG